MLYILMMLAGLAVGMLCFPVKWKRYNLWVQTGATVLLLFTMGLSFGMQPDFLANILSAGWTSLIYAAAAIFGSVAIVYILSKVLKDKET